MKKRGISALLPLLLLLLLPLVCMPAPAQAAGTVSRIVLDGEVLMPRDVTGKQVIPFVQDGTTYLPVRAIGQAFEMDVAWDQDSNAAYVGVPTDGGAPQKQIRVFVDGNLLQPKDVNGKFVPPIAMEGTVYLPVRALSQALGCSVAWDQETRTVTLYAENAYHTEPWRLVYMGDWSMAKNAATLQKQIAEQFALVAKPYARWGIAGVEPRTVAVQIKADFKGDSDIVQGSAAYALPMNGSVFCRADLINKDPTYAYYLLHEFSHCLQQYKPASAWWSEHLAEYSTFRYFASPAGRSVYSASDSTVRDWKWEPYGHSQWFLNWLDERWPTRQTQSGVELGLVDRIHFAMLYNEVASDGGKAHTDAGINAIVRAYTGSANLEALRQQYVKELDSGAWKFTGFSGMEDSFLTDGVNVQVETVSTADSLLRGARMLGEKDGYAGAYTGSALTDGNLETIWDKPDFSGERSPYAVWDLGAQKALTSVTLLGYYADWEGGWFPGGWDLLVSADGKAWTTAVSCRNATRVSSSLSFPRVSGRYVMLRLTETADPGIPANIRECMVFGPESVPADSAPVSSGTSHGATWTARTQNGLPDGSGRAEGADGVYIGEFLRGERQGQGTLYRNDGSVLECRWIHGAIYGPGRLTRSDGSRVIGTWENGELHGTAWEVKTDGTVQEQTWDHGTLQSSAPMARTTWEDGYSYEGYRVQGKAEGYGRRSYSGATYEGTFSNGQPLGKGKMTYAGGETFTGTWYADGTAEGTYHWSNGFERNYRLVGGKFYEA